MKHTCKYHPAEQASWHCPEDGIHFCEECVSSDDSADGGRARCFLCNKTLQQQGRQIARAPFWKILSHFMQYPVTTELAVVVAALAVLTAVLPLSWTGIALAMAVGLPLGILAAAIFEQTANAHMRPPGYKVLGNQDHYILAIQLWLLFASALVLLGYAFISFGMLKGAGFALLAWLILPALLIQLVLDGHILVPLLAPARLLTTIATIGADYFIAGVVLFAGFLGLSIVCSVLYDLLPSFIGLPACALVTGWFFLMMCHLLGYLICQHRDQLGFTSSVVDEEGLRNRRARRPEDERKIAVWLREGRYEKVVAFYKAKLEKQTESVSLNDQFGRLLSVLGRKEEQLAHGALYIDVLMNNDQEYRVTELIKRYREIDPSFRPSTVQSTWQVAQLLESNGEHKLALNLLVDLHKRAPTWPGLAEAYLFVARLLKTEFKLDGKADQYIRFVETRFKDPKSQEMAVNFRAEVGMPKSS